ncbi:MAG: hypothetical protein LDL41_10015 [Coleofasciculus sp. S288]|nr:hypothetical protein [Coleofasciculus sp. S288]
MQGAHANGKEIRQKIQAASATTLKKLPAERIERSSQETAGLFLTQVSKLLEEGTQAMTWSDEQLESFTLQTALLRLGFEMGIQYGDSSATEQKLKADVTPMATNPSCSFECKRLRDECLISECAHDTSWPCFCCVPCNTTWLACLAGCVVG